MDPAILSLLVLLLFGGHAVADYGLQSAFVAEHKVERPGNPDWFVTLAAHCLIHGFVVGTVAFAMIVLAGGSLHDAAALGSLLGWLETAVHFAIDHAKGKDRFGYRIDQLLHYGFKLLWALVVYNAFA